MEASVGHGWAGAKMLRFHANQAENQALIPEKVEQTNRSDRQADRQTGRQAERQKDKD